MLLREKIYALAPYSTLTASQAAYKIRDKRIYGRFDCTFIAKKILSRRRRALQKRKIEQGEDLDLRLDRWRKRRVQGAFRHAVAIFPSGVTRFYIRWSIDNFRADTRSDRASNETDVDVRLRLHPHWYRRFGELAMKNRCFLLDLKLEGEEIWSGWMGLEVRKSRGYSLKTVWSRIPGSWVKEFNLDVPWERDPSRLIGLDSDTPGIGRPRRNQVVGSLPPLLTKVR